jgi:hypothetical protein
MMFRRIFIVSFLVFSLMSCLDEYNVPIQQLTEQLVVEARLTDEDVTPTLRLSVTTQFGTASTYKPVQGALVRITDNTGKAVVFRSSPTQPGYYLPSDLKFRGQPANTYTLSITLPDGRVFESVPETMPASVPIQNVRAQFQGPITEGKVTEPGYKVFVDVQDPKSTQNYYRWTAWGVHKRKSTGVRVSFTGVCCDVCWVRKDDNAVNMFSDAGVDGSTLKGRLVFLSPFYYYGKHHVEVTQYNISRNTFQFWRRYQEQLQRTGTIFDPIPAPVVGNITNKANPTELALGYFEVASVSKKRLVIPGDTLVGKLMPNSLFVQEGDCMAAYQYSLYDIFPPPGW